MVGANELGETLSSAVNLALRGDQRAQKWLEEAATPSLKEGIQPLMALWEACFHLLKASGGSGPVPYFLASLLKRNVKAQWGPSSAIPADTQQQLKEAAWVMLRSLAEQKDRVDQVIADPAIKQLVSVVVSQALGGEQQSEAHALLMRSMAAENTSNVMGMVLGLLLVTSLVEEAERGFGGPLQHTLLPGAGREVCEAILQVWGASVQQFQGQGDMAALMVLTRAACEALARWAKYGRLGWSGWREVGRCIEAAVGVVTSSLQTGPSSAYVGVLVRAVEEVVEARQDAQQAQALVGPEPAAPYGDEMGGGDEGVREEAVCSLLRAVVGLIHAAASSDPEDLRVAYHATVLLVQQEKHWLLLPSSPPSPSSPLALQALDMLVQGSDSSHRPTSSTCLQVWCDIHKLSLKRRLSELGVPLYQQLVQVTLTRAASAGVESEEDEDEEGAREEYREQVLFEVMYRCYELLRSDYIAILEAHLSSLMQSQQWRAVEAVLFAVRVVAMDACKRAALADASPAALQNAARISNKTLGTDWSGENVKADGQRTRATLLSLLSRLLSPSSPLLPSCPSPPPPYVVIGCVRVLYGLASFMARAGSDSTAIAHQALAYLLSAIERVPESRTYAVDAVRVCANRCSELLSTQGATVCACLHSCLCSSIFSSYEDAVTLTHAATKLIQPPSSLPSHLTTPLLERLQSRGAISSATAVELRCLATVLRYGDARVAMEVLSSAWPLLSTYVAMCCKHASTQPPPSGQQGGPTSCPQKNGGPVGWAGVWEALLDVLGRAASLPLSQRAMAIRQGGDEAPHAQIQVAITVLNEVITAAHEGGMGDRAVGSFLAFAVEVIESWGYRAEEEAAHALLCQHIGQAAPQESAGDQARAMVGGLLSAVWPLVGRDVEGIELVNLCLRNCPLILEERVGLRQGVVPAAMTWCSDYTEDTVQPGLVCLLTVVDLPGTLIGAAAPSPSDAPTQWSIRWTAMQATWEAAVADVLPTLMLSLVTGLLGGAPDSCLDALTQLLRAVLVRFNDHALAPLLPLLSPPNPQHPGHGPTGAERLSKVLSNDRALRDRLIPVLSLLPRVELSEAREIGEDVWGYCQGTKGVEKLDMHLRTGRQHRS